MFRLVYAVILFSLAIEPLAGGSLIQKLPVDGSWVAFQWTENFDEGTKRTLRLTLKSVGKQVVDSTPCRWIELEFTPDEPDAKTHVLKFLIPEEQLTEKGDPLSHVKEAWRATVGELSAKLDDRYIQQARPRLNILLSPPISNLRLTGDRRRLDWQQGQLDCEVHQGQHEQKTLSDHVDVQFRLAVSDQVPFGVAASQMTFRGLDGSDSNGTSEFVITDMGKGAVSKINIDFPDDVVSQHPLTAGDQDWGRGTL